MTKPVTELEDLNCPPHKKSINEDWLITYRHIPNGCLSHFCKTSDIISDQHNMSHNYDHNNSNISLFPLTMGMSSIVKQFIWNIWNYNILYVHICISALKWVPELSANDKLLEWMFRQNITLKLSCNTHQSYSCTRVN